MARFTRDPLDVYCGRNKDMTGTGECCNSGKHDGHPPTPTSEFGTANPPSIPPSDDKNQGEHRIEQQE